MLVIKSFVDKSDIEGLGCFSAQKIEKGDIIWFLDPVNDQIFSEDEFEKIPFDNDIGSSSFSDVFDMKDVPF